MIYRMMLAAALLMPVSAFAADNMDNSSSVDPAGQKADAPKSNPASPGTVGAMKGAEGGSFTASKPDQKNMKLK